VKLSDFWYYLIEQIFKESVRKSEICCLLSMVIVIKLVEGMQYKEERMF